MSSAAAAAAAGAAAAATGEVMGRGELTSPGKAPARACTLLAAGHLCGSTRGEAAVGEGEGRSTVRPQASSLGDGHIGCGHGRCILPSGVGIACSCVCSSDGMGRTHGGFFRVGVRELLGSVGCFSREPGLLVGTSSGNLGAVAWAAVAAWAASAAA